jgi:hypothetical protein
LSSLQGEKEEKRREEKRREDKGKKREKRREKKENACRCPFLLLFFQHKGSFGDDPLTPSLGFKELCSPCVLGW